MKIKKDFIPFIKSLNYNIALNLLKTRRCSYINFKLDINDSFKKFLQTKYELKGRFINCNRMLSELKMVSRNFYNMNDSHQILNGSFQMKVGNRRKIIIHTKKGSKLLPESHFSSPYITVKFVRENNISLSEEDRTFLFQYRRV